MFHKHRQVDFFSVYARRSNGTFVAWLSSSASALPIPVRDEFFYASFFSQNFAELGSCTHQTNNELKER